LDNNLEALKITPDYGNVSYKMKCFLWSYY